VEEGAYKEDEVEVVDEDEDEEEEAVDLYVEEGV
jgi:hypothetical protein